MHWQDSMADSVTTISETKNINPMIDAYLIPFLIATCMFAPSSWFFYISALFFVPQIIHNIRRGGKYKFDSSYVFLLGAARMIIPVNF